MIKYLLIAIFLFLLNIPLRFLDIYLINIIITLISFIFFLKYKLNNINLLNEKCNPKLFFEKNKYNKNQILNNCFAILHMYNKENDKLFLEYFEKAKQKKNKSNIYKMKLEYLFINYKLLNQDNCEESLESFNKNWNNNKLISLQEQKYIKNFTTKKHSYCMLDSVIKHFEQGVLFYKNNMKELAKSEFEYVKTYGGTTIYKETAINYLENLKNYTCKNIKKDRISLKNKYLCNKNIIDFIFCIYLVLFILTNFILGGLI